MEPNLAGIKTGKKAFSYKYFLQPIPNKEQYFHMARIRQKKSNGLKKKYLKN
jgi:hypothetical protein